MVNPGEGFAWSSRAEGVHGFTRDEVLAAPSAKDVDEALCTWLLEQGIDADVRGGVIPVGFNVGAFDMPHLAVALPQAHAMFSRRTVDLNSVCFTIDGMVYGGMPVSASGWKRMAKTYADRVLHAAGTVVNQHDAGYDALLHLHAWRFLRSVAHGEPLAMPLEPAPPLESQILAMQVLERLGAEAGGKAVGVDPEMLKGWAQGGRCTNAHAVELMRGAAGDWG